ncbi:MAG: hypothetical protein II928_05125 [Paludibacteraceae bacterium]|nr:hypothetical protein [Paludibacteraceae bacterium]
MKKLLYIALAALVLLGCNPNDPKIPSKDKKMLDKAAQGVLNLLGQKQKNAISAAEELGFVDVSDLGSLPVRLGIKAKENTENIDLLYGDVEAYTEALESGDDEFEEFIDTHIVQNHQIFVILTLGIEDGKVIDITGILLAGQETKNIPNLYLSFSKNVFLSMDEKSREWIGMLCEMEDINDGAYESYGTKKRDDFEEDFKTYTFPYAYEDATDQPKKSAQQRTYTLKWHTGDNVSDADYMQDLVIGDFFAMFMD